MPFVATDAAGASVFGMKYVWFWVAILPGSLSLTPRDFHALMGQILFKILR
jgi:hypothetical protein